MPCMPSQSPHSPPLGLTRRWSSTACRPITTLAVLVVFLSVIGFLAIFPVHEGHPFDSLSSWGRQAEGEGELDVVRTVKPVCEKTLLYTFSGRHGFASEYGIFYRAALYAEDEGYALVVDSDPGWVYLNIHEYLEPTKLSCVPPSDWRTINRTVVGVGAWRGQAHLSTTRDLGRSDMNNHMRDRYRVKRPVVDDGDVQVAPEPVSSAPPPAMLPAEMTLLPAYEAVLIRLSGLVQKMWRPNELISREIDELVARHRLRERLSIGVHIRMGDKAWELGVAMKSEGGGSLFRQGDLSAYLTAAQEMLPLLRASPAGHATGLDPTLKPVLVVMSDQPHVAAEMESGLMMQHDFEVVQLPVPAKTSDKGHDEKQFERSPWQERLEGGEGFIRDVTIVGRATNLFIGTASSNVGRLIALLAGPEKVLQYRLARTLDTPLYWSIFYENWTY